MKPAAFLLGLALLPLAAPATAQGADMSSLFPVLTFPEPAPAPETVSQTRADLGK